VTRWWGGTGEPALTAATGGCVTVTRDATSAPEGYSTRAWRNHVENENYGIVVDVSTWVAIAIGILIGVVMAILL
jgi:hypothetical protein